VIAKAVVEGLAAAVPFEVVQEEDVELLAVDAGGGQKAVPRQLSYD
jgi:hypothetical protein